MPQWKWKMRDTETGEVREKTEQTVVTTVEGCEFLWLEHNWACDANRALEFYERNLDEAEEHRCLAGPNATQRFELLELAWRASSEDEWQDALRG